MILASHDGYTWRQPEGAAPGPVWRVGDQPPDHRGFNTDPELVYDASRDELVHIWQQHLSSDHGRIWHSKTSDGINWTPPLHLFDPRDGSGTSSSIVPNGEGGWWIFAWGNLGFRRVVSALDDPWPDPVRVTGMTGWHGGVWRDPSTGRLYGISGGSTNDPIGMFTAYTSDDDGNTWVRRRRVMSSLAGNWDDDNYYRPTIQPHPDGKHFRLWYSIHGFPGTQNRTGYTIVPRNLWDD